MRAIRIYITLLLTLGAIVCIAVWVDHQKRPKPSLLTALRGATLTSADCTSGTCIETRVIPASRDHGEIMCFVHPTKGATIHQFGDLDEALKLCGFTMEDLVSDSGTIYVDPLVEGPVK